MLRLTKKVTPKQAWWQDFLVEYDFTLQYKPVHANIMTDALNQQETLETLTTISIEIGNILEAIKAMYMTDPITKQLLQQVKNGEMCLSKWKKAFSTPKASDHMFL